MNSIRRSLIRSGAALVATSALVGSGFFTPNRARAQGAAGLPMPDVKALVFDTFGTVVDWRNGVAREAERILKPMGLRSRLARIRRCLAQGIRAEHGGGARRTAAVRQAGYSASGKSRARSSESSKSKSSPSRRSPSLTSPGTNSTPGRMSVRPLRGCTSGS